MVPGERKEEASHWPPADRAQPGPARPGATGSRAGPRGHTKVAKGEVRQGGNVRSRVCHLARVALGVCEAADDVVHRSRQLGGQ